MSDRITEESFVAAFSAAIEEVTEEPLPPGFTLDSKFIDLDLDSMSRLEVITCLEDRLQQVIGDRMLGQSFTPRDLLDALNERSSGEKD
ncbi:phosphopantetheine-binding protein [Streptomyces hygroscopicus]|uniref:acyl carrier protein n=1 Tax=Streptomyces hygroscopicus TaxID=1912 RepID=UPI000829B190|nr:acyl carrier protein [Streptomyces hygroscopicus]GLV78350.1 hypothetical protein Shyhy02_63500 [Streptomyces hygroscopicus subsp. hygroscopicus]